MLSWKTILRWRSRLWFTLLLLCLGLWFRTANLAAPVYWVDEVATSMRVAGYTRQQVVNELADGRLLSIADLQRYQQFSPGKGWADTLAALQRSPEHTPLYFLLARLWNESFGSSIVAMRSLSVVLSLLALPCLFGLSWELFGSAQVSRLAIGLLAVSPFFVAYSQEARPYSLWAVVLLVNGWLLLRAMRLNDRPSWLGYGISAAVSLYTSLLSGLVLLAQALYVAVLVRSRSTPSPPTQTMQRFLLAAIGAIGAFLPWLWVIAQHWAMLQDNTTWSRSALTLLPLLAIWLYNIAVIYFDVPVVATPLWMGLLEVSIALIVTGLIGYSIYFVWTRTAKRCGLFVLSLIVAIPVWLISLDLLRGQQLSTAARYMLPSQLGIQLAMAYLLATKTQRHKEFLSIPSLSPQSNPFGSASRTVLAPPSFRKWICGLLITLSLVSCLFQLQQPPKYQKSRNLHNQPIAAIVNQASSPLLLAESQQILDVISLSYTLKPETKIQLFSGKNFIPCCNQCQNIFVFNPSQSLQTQLRSQQHWRLQPVYQPQRLIPDEITLSLWSIIPPDTNCAL